MKKLFIFLSIIMQVFSKQWVDPHDMNINAKQYLKRSVSTGDLHMINKDCDVNIGESNSLLYLKRVINLLLNSANLNKNDLEYHGHIPFTITGEDLKFLKSFSTIEQVNIEDLRKVDTVLSKSLQRSYLDNVTDMFLFTQEKIFQLLCSHNCLPLLGSCLFLYIVYNLFRSNFSTWYVVRYLIVTVFIIDFVQRYQQLYQEAEEHNMHLKYSSKCDTTKMSWGEYFTFLTSNEDCEKKVVSLLEVGLNQVKSVIIVPLAAAGTGMGQFGSGLWTNLPFPWNILIFPIMLVFCCILTVIVLSTINNTSFKFNLMHLLHLEFGEKKSDITGKTLDKLLDAVNHRPMLQEVHSIKKKDKSPPKTKSIKVKKEVKNKPLEQKETEDIADEESVCEDNNERNKN